MTDERRYQYVSTKGKPDWCPAMILAEVWDEDEKPAECRKEFVTWDGRYYMDADGVAWLHASPVLKPEPKPRSWVWWWGDTWDDVTDCEYMLYMYAKDDSDPFIPARIIDGELEPAPTVAEARARKEAGE